MAKKIISLLLSLVIIFSLSVNVFALDLSISPENYVTGYLYNTGTGQFYNLNRTNLPYSTGFFTPDEYIDLHSNFNLSLKQYYTYTITYVLHFQASDTIGTNTNINYFYVNGSSAIYAANKTVGPYENWAQDVTFTIILHQDTNIDNAICNLVFRTKSGSSVAQLVSYYDISSVAVNGVYDYDETIYQDLVLGKIDSVNSNLENINSNVEQTNSKLDETNSKLDKIDSDLENAPQHEYDFVSSMAEEGGYMDATSAVPTLPVTALYDSLKSLYNSLTSTDTVDTLTLPKAEVFGFTLWDEQTISFSDFFKNNLLKIIIIGAYGLTSIFMLVLMVKAN